MGRKKEEEECHLLKEWEDGYANQRVTPFRRAGRHGYSMHTRTKGVPTFQRAQALGGELDGELGSIGV